MARAVVLFLIAFGLQVVAAPSQAEAAVGVTIHASRTVLMNGESAVLRGRATGAKPGSVVRLQRKVAGRWGTIRSKRIRSTRRYSFLVRPADGYQDYRVIKPRQLGQRRAVSTPVRLTVRWNPTLSATAEYGNDGTVQQTIRITGRVDRGPRPVTRLVLERKDADAWTIIDRRDTFPSDSFSFEVHDEPGPAYRVRMPASELTTERISPTFVHTSTPYAMPLNSGVVLELKATSGTAAVVTFDAVTGNYLSLLTKGTGPGYVARVTSPSGQEVTSWDTGSPQVSRFTAPEPGTYTLTLGELETDRQVGLWLTIPKVFDATVDGSEVVVDSDLPGQPADITLHSHGTAPFTVADHSTTSTTVTVLDPEGEVVDPWLPEVFRYREPVYRTQAETQTVRLVETVGDQLYDTPVRALTVNQMTASVNGPFVEAVVDVPDRVVLVQFERTDEPVTVGYPFDDRADVGVFDVATGESSPTGPGTSVVAVSAFDDVLLTLPLQVTTPLHLDAVVNGGPVPVDLPGSYRRTVALHFHAVAGQVVSLEATKESSDGFWGGLIVLQGEQGTIPNLYTTRGLWVTPTDGDYTVTMDAFGELVGSLALGTADSLTIPGDGTPVTVNIDEPGELIVATIPMAAGTLVDATLDEVSPSLGDTWDVMLITPDNSYWYNSWRIPGTLPPFTVRDPENIVAVITAGQTGSLRLAFAPRP